jgi:hypothetical protein
VSLYPVDGHPLLSPAAAALDADALEAQSRVAERVLGLADTNFTGDDAITASDAVALQVSYQVAMPPEQAIILSETRGSRSVTYRGGSASGVMAMVSATAQAIVDGLIGTNGSAWGVAGPRR